MRLKAAFRITSKQCLRHYSTPSPLAPHWKAIVDIKAIRQNPELYKHHALERNYTEQAAYPARIILLHEEWHKCQHEGQYLRARRKLLNNMISNQAVPDGELSLKGMSKKEGIDESVIECNS
jgi:seryl-tRNA synthetase